MCVPHCIDLQPSSCVNKEVKQNDKNNFNENSIQFTANFNHNQKTFYKNSARNNNLRFIDSDNNQVLTHSLP